MPRPVYIEHEGQRINWRAVAAVTGLCRRQAAERIRKGLTGPDLLAPKRSPKECARMNPDPFGWSWRRQA